MFIRVGFYFLEICVTDKKINYWNCVFCWYDVANFLSFSSFYISSVHFVLLPLCAHMFLFVCFLNKNNI